MAVLEEKRLHVKDFSFLC
uniref:Uncharacterized protein n=1 Tax=Anguilla anguilla TaxID=7936 RepID=A0A0E9UU11_ANGAN